MPSEKEMKYLGLLIGPMRACANYRPAFGGEAEGGVSGQQFQELYGQDPLYHWVGLDSALMYAAHKAAGGMTSVYRQLGIGCERLLREIVKDELLLDEEQARWSYEYQKDDGKRGVHTLDFRINIEDVRDGQAQARIRDWLERCGRELNLPAERISELRGTVFEVRQGYKSADSKRQNADLRFGMRAYNEGYIPVIGVVSTQVSAPVMRRYSSAQIAVLRGSSEGDTRSTFTFFSSVVGFDVAAFFEKILQ